MADNFETTYQKVGTFRIVNGQKQGGNVASYVCLSDGTVVHTVAGPREAREYLQELRWAVDLRKNAASEANGDIAKYRLAVRKGHLERLNSESGRHLALTTLPVITRGAPPVPSAALLSMEDAKSQVFRANPKPNPRARLNNQGQVHLLLAYYPLPKIQQLYTIVFENILNEKVSSLPVVTK